MRKIEEELSDIFFKIETKQRESSETIVQWTVSPRDKLVNADRPPSQTTRITLLLFGILQNGLAGGIMFCCEYQCCEK